MIIDKFNYINFQIITVLQLMNKSAYDIYSKKSIGYITMNFRGQNKSKGKITSTNF